MDGLDIFLTIVYVMVSIMLGLVIRHLNKKAFIYRKYFLAGMMAKLAGGIGFALVYTYYYTYGGDTMTYFADASVLVELLLHNPAQFVDVLFSSPERLFFQYPEVVSKLGYPVGTSEWFTDKTASFASLVGMNNYYSTTVVFSMLSYYGVWKLFLVLTSRYPRVHKALAFSLLFVPSVFFWGSGIMKDSIVIGFLGLLVYQADRFTRGGGGVKILSLASAVFCAYMIFNVKAYVVVSLVPALLLWIVLNYHENIKSKFVRAFIFPLILALSFVAVAFSVQLLGSYTSKYSLENVLGTAEGIQSWHYVEGENTSENNGRGSSYTLGEYEPTVLGILSRFPAAVNVALFRPYLWEVTNVAMLATSIESTIIFLFSLFIFLGLGFKKVVKLLFKDSFLFMAVSFSIFFAFAVGFTTYNFGALARYKIPCIPFYLSSLFILRFKVKELKEKSRMRLAASRKGRRINDEANAINIAGVER